MGVSRELRDVDLVVLVLVELQVEFAIRIERITKENRRMARMRPRGSEG